MNKIFKKIIVVIMTSSCFACTPNMKTQRIDTEKADKLAMSITDEWVLKDTEIAVSNIIGKMTENANFQDYLLRLGRKPKIFIGEIQNQTSEAYFPVGDLNDELLNEFSLSGDFVLIDESSRDKILKELKYQNDGMVPPEQAKNIGKASGADLIIFGDIRMKPETLKNKTIKNYTVNLRMTDIETGEEILRIRYKTSKYSIHKDYSW